MHCWKRRSACKGVLAHTREATQREAQQVEESHLITDDEPNPAPRSTVEDAHASWEQVVRALTDVHTALAQIEHAEQQTIEREPRRVSGKAVDGLVSIAQFTLEEAARWIGHTVIAKTDFHAGRAQIAAEQQGTVISVHGEPTLQGTPVLYLAVQFWPEKQDEVPSVIFVTHRVFTEYLCLSHTVGSLTDAMVSRSLSITPLPLWLSREGRHGPSLQCPHPKGSAMCARQGVRGAESAAQNSEWFTPDGGYDTRPLPLAEVVSGGWPGQMCHTFLASAAHRRDS
jgi:hypothetical protein